MKPVLLLVLDGWGYRRSRSWNAIAKADVTNFNSYWRTYPHTLLEASGASVGLPDGFMGGSEVGHIHLGAGRPVPQEMRKISDAIADGSFFKNKILIDARKRGRVHLIGLASDSGVHSHISHLFALLEFFKRNETYVHCFLDGRDTPPKSAKKYLNMIEDRGGRIATLCGRYYAMDRDNRWDRTRKAFDCLVKGKGRTGESALEALELAYGRGETDEFVLPTLIDPRGTIKDGDAVVFFNFRSDRARELTKLFLEETKVFFVSMVRYSKELNNKFLFSLGNERNTLGEVISKQGLKQLRVAETEKYAHVTYFFNNGAEKPFKGEERIVIPSLKVATYDMKPEMCAEKIKNVLLEKLPEYDFILANFANADMVGHTGNMDATVKACKEVDRCLGEVVGELRKLGGCAIIVGDHGNAEMMRYRDGSMHTSHTTNPVPCIIVCDRNLKLRRGSLYDVAPTILQLMKIRKPKEMTGKSLII